MSDHRLPARLTGWENSTWYYDPFPVHPDVAVRRREERAGRQRRLLGWLNSHGGTSSIPSTNSASVSIDDGLLGRCSRCTGRFQQVSFKADNRTSCRGCDREPPPDPLGKIGPFWARPKKRWERWRLELKRYIDEQYPQRRKERWRGREDWEQEAWLAVCKANPQNLQDAWAAIRKGTGRAKRTGESVRAGSIVTLRPELAMYTPISHEEHRFTNPAVVDPIGAAESSIRGVDAGFGRLNRLADSFWELGMENTFDEGTHRDAHDDHRRSRTAVSLKGTFGISHEKPFGICTLNPNELSGTRPGDWDLCDPPGGAIPQWLALAHNTLRCAPLGFLKVNAVRTNAEGM